MIENKPHKTEVMLFLIAIVMIGIGIYYLGPSIIGFIIKEFSYEQDLNLVVTSSGSYTWQLKNISNLKSIKLDGGVTTYGKARVYIESNGIRYLIFDSTRLNESAEIKNKSNNSITGFAIEEGNVNKDKTDSDADKKKKDKKPEWIGADEFDINGTTLINLSQQFKDKDNDFLIYAASEAEGLETAINNEIITITPKSDNSFNTTIAFTASDGIDSTSHIVILIINVNMAASVNQTINQASENLSINTTPTTNLTANITQFLNETINQTQIINNTNETINLTTQTNQTKTIAINLSYHSGTIYDANDNGEESVNGVVDLTAENTKFSWNVDESKLCTRWEVYSIDDEKLTTFCNGNANCCAFVNLLPANSDWSNLYYSTLGKDDASHNNIVSAQVLYFDVNLSIENPKSEIYYSEWANLSVKFYDEEIKFSNICLETCSLKGLNKSSYNLIFEIEDNAVLKIDKIKYILTDVENNAPLLLKEFSTINVGKNKNATINLSQYFADADLDILNYNYYHADNITILFDSNAAVFIPDRDFEGVAFTYITANDSEKTAVSNLFMVNVSAVNEATANITAGYYFEIRDKQDNKLAVFDSFGDLRLKGALVQEIQPTADENDFAIQNLTNGLNAVIMNPEGNLIIKGALNENQSSLMPTPNSFIIQNKDGEAVAYINSTGSLFLKGILMENASFG